MEEEKISEVLSAETENQPEEELNDGDIQTEAYPFFLSLVDAIADPARLFSKIAKKPVVWKLVIFLSVLSLGLQISLLPKFIPIYKASAVTIAAEQGKKVETIESGLIVSLYVQTYAGFIFVILALLLKSGILYFLLTFFMQCEKKFSYTFSVVAYSWIPLYIHQVIATIQLHLADLSSIVDVRQIQKISTLPAGLDIFFNADEIPVWLFSILSEANIFSVWCLILTAYGISVVYKTEYWKSFCSVFVIWVLYIGTIAGLAAVGSAFGG